MDKGLLLVVDDELPARTALRELLTDEGYRVELAADGEEALAKATALSPDIVLTDIRMPGLDGLELLRRLRASDSSASVVMMTAYGDFDSVITAMKAGAADYIVKPLDVPELLPVLSREMERRRASIAAPRAAL